MFFIKYKIRIDKCIYYIYNWGGSGSEVSSPVLTKSRKKKKKSGSQSGQGSSSTGSENKNSSSSAEKETKVQVEEDGTYTSKEEVAAYIHEFGHLPDNYITKNQAKKLGWVSTAGNLDEVAPGKRRIYLLHGGPLQYL